MVQEPVYFTPDVLSLTCPVLAPGPKPLAIFSGQTGRRDGLFHSSGHSPDHRISQLWLPQAPHGVQEQVSAQLLSHPLPWEPQQLLHQV